MIDVLSMPAVANDIRLSTLEPVQQLGARLANILSGELSRLRADAAFALATGATLQTLATDGDRIRAEQLTSIGARLVSLDTQAINTSRSSSEDQDRRFVADDQSSSEEFASTRESCIESAEHDGLLMAVSRALQAVHCAAEQEGVSGHPVACVLPLAPMLVAQDDAAIERVTDEGSGILVLCLAFDGALGDSRQVWGFVYREDRLLAQLDGVWNDDDHCPMMSTDNTDDAWSMSVPDLHQDVSVLNCWRHDDHCQGYRVRLRAGTGESDSWSWQASKWSWL